MARAHVLANGDLDLGRGVVLSARDVRLRVTTPGGPGGQHANRTLSRVVATVDVAHAPSLPGRARARLTEALGPLVHAQSSGSRSQAQNRAYAIERLAHKLALALEESPERRSTKPTRSSVDRRLESKKRRAKVKAGRRDRDED